MQIHCNKTEGGMSEEGEVVTPPFIRSVDHWMVPVSNVFCNELHI